MKAGCKTRIVVEPGTKKRHQKHKPANPPARYIKLRWTGLFFFAVLTFILFSSSHYVRLQSEAIATEKSDAHTLEQLSYGDNTPSPPPDTMAAPVVADTTISVQQDDSILTTEILALQTMSTDTKLPQVSEDNPVRKRHSWVVKSGDTLSEILSNFDVYEALGPILELGKRVKPLLYLRAGKTMHLDVEEGILQKITYELNPTEYFIAERSVGGKIVAKHYQVPIEKRTAFASGFINNSFYNAGLKAGLSDELIIKAAYILGWDIDFVIDIRSGDFFSIIYEEEFSDGVKISDGDIIGVELINRGKSYRAIRYAGTSDGGEYFSPEGRNVKKPFLRTPLEFTRVSSKFNPRRLHPILNVVRPHRGVDYAAPSGTPVYATAEGTVIFRGWKAGYGNTVILRHHGSYTTLYAHLSKFTRSAKVGNSIRQRQNIGYVGMTGYATGPHLHYEFRVNGTHKNPLTVNLPDSRPLPQSQLAAFKTVAAPILDKLNTINRSYAAARIKQQ